MKAERRGTGGGRAGAGNSEKKVELDVLAWRRRCKGKTRGGNFDRPDVDGRTSAKSGDGRLLCARKGGLGKHKIKKRGQQTLRYARRWGKKHRFGNRKRGKWGGGCTRITGATL